MVLLPSAPDVDAKNELRVSSKQVATQDFLISGKPGYFFTRLQICLKALRKERAAETKSTAPAISYILKPTTVRPCWCSSTS